MALLYFAAAVILLASTRRTGRDIRAAAAALETPA
jgi:hypothetical protein